MAEETLDVTQQEQDPILSVDAFATKLKTKYPEYKDIDNKELVSKMLSKYPQYSSRVSMGDDIAKKPLATASSNGGQPLKSGSVTSQAFPTLTNPQNNGLDYSPLTPEYKQQQLAQDNTVREARQREKDKISQGLSKIYSQLPADSKKGWDKAMQLSAYRMEHPDTLTDPTPEEREHQDFMKTGTGKLLGTVAYLGSKATKGTLQIAKGAAWLADNTIGLGSDKSLSEQVNKLDKYSNVGLTDNDVYHMEQGKGGKVLSNLGGLVEFLPAIATGSATSETATFALQGFGQGKETIDHAEKNAGVTLNPFVKNAFVAGSGIVNALLMGDLGKGIVGKLPATIRRDVVSDITANAIKEAAGKELTGEAFQELLNNGAKKFSDKLTRFGIDALKGYKKAVIDLSALSGANFTLKKGVDVASDKPVFNENLGNLAEQVSNIATEQAPFFAAAGQVANIGKLTKYSSYKNDVVESLMSDPSEANVQHIKDILQYHANETNKKNNGVSELPKMPESQLKERFDDLYWSADRTPEQQSEMDLVVDDFDKLKKIKSGKYGSGWTTDELNSTFNQIDNIASIAKRLPRDIKPSKVAEAVDLINGRDELQSRLQEIQGAKADFDESVKDIPTKEEQLVQDKIEQANDKLQSIVGGIRISYGKDKETGKFYKTTNGKVEEITKERYDLERLERDARQQAKAEDTNEQGTNDTQPAVQPQQAEVQEQSAVPTPVGEAPVEVSAEQPQVAPAIKNANTEALSERTGITVEDTAKEKRGREVVDKEAQEAIDNDYDAPDLVHRILNEKHQASDTEVGILSKYVDATEKHINDIEKRFEKDASTMSKAEFDDLVDQQTKALSRLQDVAQAARKTGTETARALSARRFEMRSDYSLANMIARKRQANGGERLSTEQLTDVNNRFKQLEEAGKAYEAKIKELETKVNELKASQNVRQSAAERTKRKSVNKAELKEERSKIITDFRAELAKIRKTTSAVAVPYARELAAAVPFVAKMVKNLTVEGIVEIGSVIDHVHEEFKDYIDGLTKNDVRDIIAGVHNEPQPTRNELENQVRTLKTQAKLLKQIEDAEKGLTRAKSPAATIKVNEAITALRNRLKEVERSNDTPKEEKDLNAYKQRVQARIDEINQKLSDGDYSKPEKRPETQLDREALQLRREYDRLKHEFDINVEKEKLANRKKAEKIKDNVLNILSLPRALKATLDFSAVLRQGLILGIGHPTKAVEALKQMFGQTFSETKYHNWLYDLKHSEQYDLMQKSELYISDKTSPELLAREEEFTSNLAEKIPVFGKLVAGSERAYTAYLNALRTGVFIGEAGKLMDRGYTFENNPEVFKGLAKVVNVLSGRGDIPEFLGGRQPAVLSNLLFSPRFMASRIQTLYMWADPRLPKEARVLAAKDLGATLATAAVVLTMAQLSGLSVEKDPRSSDFLKIRDGDTRYDILGGLSPYVVFLAKEITGKKKPTSNSGMITLGSKKFGSPTRLSEAMQFARGKLSPLVGAGINLLDNKDLVGQEYNLYPQAIPGEFIPLPYKDVTEAAKIGGWENALKVLIPSQFGIGVSTYSNSKSSKKSSYTYTR